MRRGFLPFLPRFHAAIRSGAKTATTRTRPYGVAGDVLDTPAGAVRLIEVRRVPLAEVRDSYWREEGLASPGEFVEVWEAIHPTAGFQPAEVRWLHLFEYVGAKLPSQRVIVHG